MQQVLQKRASLKRAAYQVNLKWRRKILSEQYLEKGKDLRSYPWHRLELLHHVPKEPNDFLSSEYRARIR